MGTLFKIGSALVVAGLLVQVGRWSVGGADDPPPAASASPDTDSEEPAVWYCPMHPQIRLPDFGTCPICEMDLVPAEDVQGDPRHLTLSPEAKELARIVTHPVERKALAREVRMVGKIDYDETAVRTISAWVPGRLERLFVDYAGVRVAAGDHLVRLYSPELRTAQEELLSARSRVGPLGEGESPFLRQSTERAYVAAREKLLLWGLTEAQVAAIEERGVAEDSVVLTSPASGVVIEKQLREGAYVQTGTAIYRIADLSRLWVRLDAYEQDLAWLRHGQSVTVRAEAFPGEGFEGLVSFIDPVIDERTRTVKVRVNVSNAKGRLKPGMFVRATAHARIDASGVVLDRSLAGKWVSPMHPEIVRDTPGDCDVCGMALVPAEELGFLEVSSQTTEDPLVVPTSAVLLTGRRGIVYVEDPDAAEPTYAPREVELGPRGEDGYIVLGGLKEGEQVVVHGAFRLDSSMQILARPSLMSWPAAGAPRAEGEALSGPSLEALLEPYLALQEALVTGDVSTARAAGEELVRAADVLIEEPGTGPDWAEAVRRLRAAWRGNGSEPELEALRASLAPLTAAVAQLAGLSGNPLDEELWLVHCPMALGGSGASWLQRGDVVTNPYFGDRMLKCGTLQRAVPRRSER